MLFVFVVLEMVVVIVFDLVSFGVVLSEVIVVVVIFII